MEDNGAGREELLVARDDERSSKVCRRIQLVPEIQKLSRGSSRQINA